MFRKIQIILKVVLLSNLSFAQDKSPYDSKHNADIKKSFVFFDAYDPWEGFNRRMYKFNRQADTYVVKPAADAYQYITPDVIETGIGNVFDNIMELPVLVNSIFQLKGTKILGTAGRFIVNTTVGVLGVWDPATEWYDMIKYNEDFGQTLGYYGVPDGPYLILPILGPSTCRDGVGTLVDKVGISMLYPANTSFGIKAGVGVLEALDTRANVKIMYGEMNSMFEYEKLRAIYLHARNLQVNDSNLEKVE